MPIKKIVLTIIGFAIAMALIIGVIIPIANHGKNTGNATLQGGKNVGNNIENILK